MNKISANPKSAYILISLVILFIQSCTTVYLPNAAQTVYHENEGDVNISLFTGSTGYEGQVSYALTDHVFSGFSGGFLSADSNKENERDFIRHTYYEGDFGYYSRFGSRGRFSVAGGIGRGDVETIAVYSFFGDHAIPGKGTYYKYFLQSTFGMTSRVVDTGGNIRFNYVEFQRLRLRDQTFKGVNNFFVEPTFFLRAGWKNIRYHMQVSVVMGLKKESPFDYEFLRVNMGLSYRFNIFGNTEKQD